MNRHFTPLLLTFLFFVYSNVSFGQVSSYSFTSTQGSYQAISGGSLWASGTSISGMAHKVTLPFNFIFNGYSFNELYASQEGFVSLGSDNPYPLSFPLSYNQPIFAIAGFAGLKGGQTGTEFRTTIAGGQGNRVFTAQWTKFRAHSGINHDLNFQINLYEGTNVVEVVYGTMSNTSLDISGEVGLRGGAATDYANRTGSWAASSTGGSNAATMMLNASQAPVSGLTYRWTPVSCPGKPKAGNITSTRWAVCMGNTGYVWIENTSSQVNIQWQQSPDSINWSNISGATSTGYTTPGLTAPVYYRARVSCKASPGDSAHTAGRKMDIADPETQVASLPHYESFEDTWIFGCYTEQLPSGYWENKPGNGNASWRRNDKGSTAGWSSATSGSYTPAASRGSRSARFHAYSNGNNVTGSLDLHLNFSQAGEKTISFDFINPDNRDSLLVLISDDQGATWSRLGGYRAGYTAWQQIRLTSNITNNKVILRFQAKKSSSSGYGDFGIDNVAVYMSCQGAPAPLNITAVADDVCPDSIARLSLQNPYTEPDISYQWQSRLTGSGNPFVNIANATSVSLQSPPQATSTDYRCIIKCLNTGDSSFTPVKTISESLPKYCYCIPVYSNPCQNYFGEVTIRGEDTVTYSGSGSKCQANPGYYFNKSDTVKLATGGTYSLRIEKSGMNGDMRLNTWIDLDDNGIFDLSDTTGFFTITYTPSYYQIRIPQGAATGLHRMRIKMFYDNTSQVPACASSLRGYTYDIMAEIVPCTQIPSISWVLDTMSFCEYSGVGRLFPVIASNIDSFYVTEVGDPTIQYRGKYYGNDTVDVFNYSHPISATLSSGKSYEIRGKSSSGCAGLSVVSPPMYIQEIKAPTAQLLNDISVCKDDSALVTLTTDGTVVEWWVTGNYSSYKDTFYTKNIYAKPGNRYLYFVWNDFGCLGDRMPYYFDAYEARKPGIESINVKVSASNNMYNSIYDFEFKPAYNAQITHGRWTSGDGAVYNTPTVRHTYTKNGTYRVTLTTYNMDCDSATMSGTAYVYLYNEGGSLGLNERGAQHRFSIHPNPAQHTLWITGEPDNGLQQIVITDLSGRKIQETPVHMDQTKTSISLTDLPAGTYLLQLTTNQGREVHTFQVVR